MIRAPKSPERKEGERTPRKTRHENHSIEALSSTVQIIMMRLNRCAQEYARVAATEVRGGWRKRKSFPIWTRPMFLILESEQGFQFWLLRFNVIYPCCSSANGRRLSQKRRGPPRVHPAEPRLIRLIRNGGSVGGGGSRVW